MGTPSALLLLTVLSATGCAVFLALRLGLSAGAGEMRIRRTRRLLHWETLPQGLRFAVGPFERAVRRAAEARTRAQLRSCVPDALRLMSVALETGSTVTQALGYAARNCAEPLAAELTGVVWDLEAGRSFDEAMLKLRQRTGGSEFAYLAVAMEIQHRTGGSLGDVIGSVSQTLQQMAKLDEDLKTKTSQGRLSARIVSIMPVVLLLVLSLVSEGYLATFFSSALGIFLFLSALALELLGVLVVRRVLAIDLSSRAVV